MTKMCRKCLLNETGDDLYRTVMEYVASIPLEDRAPDEEYNRRLEFCKACGNLSNGMCSLCGCFVEVRAAKIKQNCVKDLW